MDPATIASVMTIALQLSIQAPEMVSLIQHDIDMFKNGSMSLQQLQDRFTLCQNSFTALSARWIKAP